MTPFNQYLANLAPEGETTLFVKLIKKPTGDIWMPYYPSDYDGEGAWYANTGSFIVSRFEGKPRARSQYCERVSVLVLDDIGTKSTTPPLEPTWKMETSEGNYQWGYIFRLDDQPTKAEFGAAIKAIANAGYTDRGMLNPVRNFRIEGSINLKEGKGGFASRLVSFHADKEFSLPEILVALGVTPEPPHAATISYDGTLAHTEPTTHTTITDLRDALTYIDAEPYSVWIAVGMALKTLDDDAAGFELFDTWSKTASNYDAEAVDFQWSVFQPREITLGTIYHHAKQNPTYVPPEDRGLTMLAGKVEGDPKFEKAKEPTFVQEVRYTPMPEPTDDEVLGIANKVGRYTDRQLFENLVYVAAQEYWFDIRTRGIFTNRGIDNLFLGRTYHSRRFTKADGTPAKRVITCSQFLHEAREVMEIATADTFTFQAGGAAVIHDNGRVLANLWVNHRMTGVAGDVSIWMDHVERMIPDEAIRNHVLDVMAFKYQHPHIKINHAILMYGVEGNGKDMLWSPFLHAIGQPNITVDSVQTFTGRWGYAYEKEVVVINELMEGSNSERRQLANKLKPLIAAPPMYLEVEKKGQAPYPVPNLMFVLAFTNSPTALSLASDDRRWLCVHCKTPRLPVKEARPVWDWYRAGGYQKIAHFFTTRDVSAFNPATLTVTTEYKQLMIENGRSEAESTLVDMINAGVGIFSTGVVIGPWSERMQQLRDQVNNVTLYQAALMSALKDAGWHDCGYIMARGLSRVHAWCHPDLAGEPSSDLRRLAQQNPELAKKPKFTAIKGDKDAREAD
jgi:hypothetical protein